MNTKTLKMIEFSKRIEGLSEYYFSSKLREVKSLIDSGEDIINLGIGSPDLSPPTPVIKKLKDSLNVTGDINIKAISELKNLERKYQIFINYIIIVI